MTLFIQIKLYLLSIKKYKFFLLLNMIHFTIQNVSIKIDLDNIQNIKNQKMLNVILCYKTYQL